MHRPACQSNEAKPAIDRKPRIAVCHPIDPAGHVPSGIDTFVRGILKWAPDDLDYTLLGATSDPAARPPGKPVSVQLGERSVRYLPIVSMDPTAARGRVPLIVRYMWALREQIRSGGLADADIIDFHRIEPVWLFRRDARPMNVLLHQDMSVLRSAQSDIMWRHAPWAYEAIERRLFGRLDRIYAVRQSAVERYRQLYPHLRDKFAFLPTWVDNTVFSPAATSDHAGLQAQLRAELGVPRARSLLIFVGRLDHQKDPLLLLEAFRIAIGQLPGLHLLVVGDGELRTPVTEFLRANALADHVSLLGVRGAVEIGRLLRGSDLFVMSSAYEGMPIAVLEALASGVPVATTDVGEIRLVVRPGVNGAISPARTAPALANAITTAMGALARLRGEPCTSAVVPYHPQRVLGILYDNHRRQALERRRASALPPR
jgi:glycosyltransferase involved in cell wall biosynthesis